MSSGPGTRPVSGFDMDLITYMGDHAIRDGETPPWAYYKTPRLAKPIKLHRGNERLVPPALVPGAAVP